MPDDLARSVAQMVADPTVYLTMNGPSEFHVTGTLRDWSIVERVHAINVPTLLVNGRFDEATDAVMQPFADRIRDVRRHVFANSSHLPHLEETEAYLEVVRAFLDEHDEAPPM
jgi:L-proline amide hydrolase